MTGNLVTVLGMLDRTIARKLRSAARSIEDGIEARDQFILEAHEAGASLREIAEHAGITHVAVLKIIRRNQQ